MEIFRQIGILFMICLVGEGLSLILPFPIPASIISMLLLFIVLLKKWMDLRHIEKVGHFLLKNMAFFFIPTGVSVIEHYDLIGDQLFILLFISIISTVITFLTTAFTVKAVMNLRQRRKG